MVVVIFSLFWWPNSKRVAFALISLCYKPSCISTASSSSFASSLIRLFKSNTFALTQITHYRSVPSWLFSVLLSVIYIIFTIFNN